ASMHVVQKILDDFKSGKRDVAEFYIHLRGMYVHIRYFAVRNAEKEYLGTLEVTQNIAPIQAISGDKRLLDE
ncbi:MAG: PAS domain-containing protein, partial [Sphaerochaetaceae bacterium]